MGEETIWTKLGRLKLGDFWRGLIVAIATTPITIIYESAAKGALTFDWQMITAGAVAGGCGYLIKNLLTGSGGNILTNK